EETLEDGLSGTAFIKRPMGMSGIEHSGPGAWTSHGEPVDSVRILSDPAPSKGSELCGDANGQPSQWRCSPGSRLEDRIHARTTRSRCRRRHSRRGTGRSLLRIVLGRFTSRAAALGPDAELLVFGRGGG